MELVSPGTERSENCYKGFDVIVSLEWWTLICACAREGDDITSTRLHLNQTRIAPCPDIGVMKEVVTKAGIRAASEQAVVRRQAATKSLKCNPTSRDIRRQKRLVCSLVLLKLKNAKVVSHSESY